MRTQPFRKKTFDLYSRNRKVTEESLPLLDERAEEERVRSLRERYEEQRQERVKEERLRLLLSGNTQG